MVSTYGFWMLNVATMAGKQYGLDGLSGSGIVKFKAASSGKNSSEEQGFALI